jgi:putative SOS response-associated peptidase YedK
MCGRFTLPMPWSELVKLYRVHDRPNLKPRYNIAPTQDILAVRLDQDGQQEAVQLRWGLLPFWAKEEKISYSTINARAETVAKKPAFRDPFKKRRCLIPADGYYEWKKLKDGSKQPYRITLKPEQPFSFAGLWEHWEKEDKVVESCTIIVTDANELTKDIHGRMPVILDPEDYDRWLDGSDGQNLLRPYPSEKMLRYPVSRAVGNVKNTGPELIEAIE